MGHKTSEPGRRYPGRRQNDNRRTGKSAGADDIDIFLGICNEEIIPSSKPSRLEQLHGKIVGTRTEPYHDVTVYEDGYEDWFYIGE